jgi:hypothetical protein
VLKVLNAGAKVEETQREEGRQQGKLAEMEAVIATEQRRRVAAEAAVVASARALQEATERGEETARALQDARAALQKAKEDNETRWRESGKAQEKAQQEAAEAVTRAVNGVLCVASHTRLTTFIEQVANRSDWKQHPKNERGKTQVGWALKPATSTETYYLLGCQPTQDIATELVTILFDVSPAFHQYAISKGCHSVDACVARVRTKGTVTTGEEGTWKLIQKEGATTGEHNDPDPDTGAYVYEFEKFPVQPAQWWSVTMCAKGNGEKLSCL